MDVATLQSLADEPLFRQLAGIALLLGVCLVAHFATRRWIVAGIERLTLHTATAWDDALQEAEVFRRLAGLVPAVIAWYGIQLVPEVGERVELVVARVAFAAILVLIARSISALLTATHIIYAARPENAGRPIKGYVQVAQIIISVVTTVLVVATLLDRSPLVFLSGLGALTAVLLLVFRDTILSLVASIQITGNDLVRRGDWIEMPQYGADGDVVDVALHTVKVQNWDKTITTIPTHKLIEGSFKNWRFMSLSGGRRIKRSLSIDVNSIRFLEEGEIERFAEFALLRDYIQGKRDEIESWNAAPGRNRALNADIRRLTNLGTFRAYIERYLHAHPRIHQGMTLIVRQLPSGPSGLPIELYCFTNVTNWAQYEGIQSDIFDHLLAIAPEFGLRAFQSPSGADLAGFADAVAGR